MKPSHFLRKWLLSLKVNLADKETMKVRNSQPSSRPWSSTLGPFSLLHHHQMTSRKQWTPPLMPSFCPPLWDSAIKKESRETNSRTPTTYRGRDVLVKRSFALSSLRDARVQGDKHLSLFIPRKHPSPRLTAWPTGAQVEDASRLVQGHPGRGSWWETRELPQAAEIWSTQVPSKEPLRWIWKQRLLSVRTMQWCLHRQWGKM